MKTRWRIAALVGIASAVVLAAQPWRLAERTLENLLYARLSARLGLTVESSEGGAFALAPLPRVVANNVKVRAGDGSASASIPRIRADIDLMALLTGRLTFDHVVLFMPQIEVTLPPDGVHSLDVLTSAFAATWRATPRVSIRDNGTIFFRRGPGIIAALRDVNLDISPRVAGQAVEAAGSVVWRGEKLNFAAASDSPTRAILPMLSVRSGLFNLDFAARRNPVNGVQSTAMEGQLQFTTPSMSRLGAWLASGSPVMLPLGQTTISGTAQVSREGLQVRTASVTLGTDSLEGALDLRLREQRWRLTGTFAGRSLDIGRPHSGIDTDRFGLPEWGASTPVDIDDLLAHDVDLRLSLQRVRFPNLTLSDVAAQVMANDQRLDLTVTNAALYRGVLRGRALIGRLPSGIEVRSQLTADRVDLGALTVDLFETRRLTGAGALTQQIEMTGRTPAELLASAQGRLQFTARNGDFLGTNLNDAMRRIERQPLAVARDWRGGRTAFETLTVSGALVDGIFSVTEARATGQAFRLALDGQFSLIDRQFRMNGQVQTPAGGSIVPFDVIGPAAEPSVMVNARALLERSGAAAPLLGRNPD